MENNRQKKIGGVLQNDLAGILQQAVKDAGHSGILISVSKVQVTVDLSIAKVYVSIFPVAHAQKLLDEINLVKGKIKHQVAQFTKNQLRRMPELLFYLDDSLEYIDGIDRAVKGKENPLSNPDLLERRKKI